MKEYKKIKLFLTEANTDLISGALWELNIGGITEETNYLEVFYNAEDKTIPQKVEELCKLLGEENLLTDFRIELDNVENKNWNEEWEKNLQVIKPAEKIVIKPSNKTYDEQEGDLVITIDPKMSFGTGNHATTQIMVTLLEKYYSNQKTVLDLGTGTGLLAIASIKLGAEKALATDIDEWSILNSKENIALNNVENMVQILEAETSDLPEDKYDFVLANINTNVLREIAKDISIRIKDNGYLILSGLLSIDKAELTELYDDAGFEFTEAMNLTEWSGLVLKKKPR